MATPNFVLATSDASHTIVFEARTNVFASNRIPSVILTKESTLRKPKSAKALLNNKLPDCKSAEVR
jgi:hypothetical protein